jgi:hypothetical protein
VLDRAGRGDLATAVGATTCGGKLGHRFVRGRRLSRTMIKESNHENTTSFLTFFSVYPLPLAWRELRGGGENEWLLSG